MISQVETLLKYHAGIINRRKCTKWLYLCSNDMNIKRNKSYTLSSSGDYRRETIRFRILTVTVQIFHFVSSSDVTFGSFPVSLDVAGDAGLCSVRSISFGMIRVRSLTSEATEASEL